MRWGGATHRKRKDQATQPWAPWHNLATQQRGRPQASAHKAVGVTSVRRWRVETDTERMLTFLTSKFMSKNGKRPKRLTRVHEQ